MNFILGNIHNHWDAFLTCVCIGFLLGGWITKKAMIEDGWRKR